MTVAGDLTAPVDAIVVGAGPNGLAAAITLARAGRSVRVYEAAPTAGGGTRTAELTLPGFRHDVCSTILPLTIASPFFATIDLAARGVELIHPDAPCRAPARRRPRGGPGAVGGGDRGRGLGGADGRAWRRLFGPLVRDAGKLGRGDPPAGRPRPAPPAGARALRAAGAPVGAGPGARPVRRRGGPGAVRRDRGPLDAQPRSPVECLVRARPRDVCPRGRLADDPRRGGRRRGRRSSPSSRRRAASW